ncbi:flagellar biosynthesis protein FlgA [Nonomuraea sp. WAC 01424]|uniref:RcpC/CpaB family pilus assembly protein n=1 Tax=Nonomuraea sp. WAC 01424 TaxID=2203200 RepID=UPI000F76C7AB|nr:RcpC/CpaB family pilus assembly protein [Nonomuraea sp. WAC 01424]RSN08350.1 flagellar biosynthesis protein FlgA [Nonomuraea sp. WAC 01424]
MNRQPAWLRPRARRRRLIAAALAALGVLSAFVAIRPAADPEVLVAARDLTPGPLRPGDLRPVPLAHPPDGAVRSYAAGRYLAGPMRRGEPLTDARLLHSLTLPPGTVAAPVRIADPDAVTLISPGATIGVLAAWEGGQPARLIADDIRVLTVPRPADDTRTSGALVVLAATPDQAAQLAGAQLSGRLSITLKI